MLMPFHAFLSTWGGTEIGPLLAWKSWKEVLLALCGAVIIIWIAQKTSVLKQLISDKLVIVIIIYGLLTALLAVINYNSNGVSATVVGIALNLRFPAIFLLAYIVFRFGHMSYEKWRHFSLIFLVIIGTLLAVLGIIQVLFVPKEFLTFFGYDKGLTIAPFILIDDNPDALRAFVTLRGPNDYGAYLILPLIASMAMGFQQKRLWVITALISIAIIFSGSRSAWIGAMIAVSLFVLLRFGKKVFVSTKSLVTISIVALFIAMGLYASLVIPELRLAVFHSSPGDSSLTEGSTDAHWQAANESIERATLAGCGPGCSGPASYYGDAPKISENYYLQIVEEVGITGIILFIIIMALIAQRLYTSRDDTLSAILLSAGAGIAVIGMWLHVWSDDPLSLTYFALVGMVLGYVARSDTSNNKTKK